MIDVLMKYLKNVSIELIQLKSTHDSTQDSTVAFISVVLVTVDANKDDVSIPLKKEIASIKSVLILK